MIEVVDDAVHTDTLLAILDEVLDGGMVTMETVRVVRYAARRGNR